MDWRDEGNPWRVRSTRTAYENPWLAIEENDVVHPDGSDGFYGVVRIRKLAVGVLPIDDDGFVHLVGQWRFPLGRYSWEMPEGGAEPGEDPEICARRELAEESGLRAGTYLASMSTRITQGASTAEVFSSCLRIQRWRWIHAS